LALETATIGKTGPQDNKLQVNISLFVCYKALEVLFSQQSPRKRVLGTGFCLLAVL